MGDPLADLSALRGNQPAGDPLSDLATIRLGTIGKTGSVGGGWEPNVNSRHPAAVPPTPDPSLTEQLANSFGAAGQGFWDTTGRPLVDLHKAGMVESDSPGGYGWGVLKALGKGVVNSMNSEEDAAANDFHNDQYISGAGHHLAASIPILGPLAAEIGTGLGTGIGEAAPTPSTRTKALALLVPPLAPLSYLFDPGGDSTSTTLARTAGKLGGLAALEMVRGGISKLKEITPPAPGQPGGAISNALEGSHGPGRLPFREYRDRQFAAESASYDKAAADLTQQHAADAAAAAQKARTQYGTNLKNFKGANNRLIGAARTEVAKVAPLSAPEDIGAATGDAIESVKGTAQELYNHVSEATAPIKVARTVTTQRPTGILDANGKPTTLPQTSQQMVDEGGVQVDLSGQKAIAQRYIDRLSERPYATPGTADIVGQLQRIVDGPDKTSFAGASGSASDLLDAARKLDEPLPKLRGKINAEIAGELKRSTNAAVADQAPEAAEALEHANKLWADLHRPGVVELLDRADNAPETVHRWLSEPGTTLRDLRDARKVLSPAVWRSMNARALADELENSIKTKTIDPPDKTLPVVSVPRFGDALTNKLDEWDRSGKLVEMFPDTANTLRQIVKTSGELRKPALVKPGSTPLDVEGTLGKAPQPYKPQTGLGSWLIDVAMGGYGLHSLMHNDWAGLSRTAAAGATTYGVAKLLTNPTSANLVLRYIKAQSAGNAGLVASLGTKLAALATREQRMQAPPPLNMMDMLQQGDAARRARAGANSALASGPPAISAPQQK